MVLHTQVAHNSILVVKQSTGTVQNPGMMQTRYNTSNTTVNPNSHLSMGVVPHSGSAASLTSQSTHTIQHSGDLGAPTPNPLADASHSNISFSSTALHTGLVPANTSHTAKSAVHDDQRQQRRVQQGNGGDYVIPSIQTL